MQLAGPHGAARRDPRCRGQRLPQRGVHLGRDLAQPLGLSGEVPADLVGVEVPLAQQVTDRALREIPALDPAREELLGEGEVPASRVDPAVRLSDVRAADPGQRGVDLDVGVQPRWGAGRP